MLWRLLRYHSTVKTASKVSRAPAAAPTAMAILAVLLRPFFGVIERWDGMLVTEGLVMLEKMLAEEELEDVDEDVAEDVAVVEGVDTRS